MRRDVVVTLAYGLAIGVAIGITLEASGALAWLDGLIADWLGRRDEGAPDPLAVETADPGPQNAGEPIPLSRLKEVRRGQAGKAAT